MIQLGSQAAQPHSPLNTPGRPINRLQRHHNFCALHAPLLCGFTLFSHLYFLTQDGSSILSGVTGEFKHSHLYAVMGPSGAGKV